ncbi:MAG: hypothetical protein ACKVQS_01360 [Fimbriimonadaceae bacterium]
MKKLSTLVLGVLLVGSVLAFAGCAKKEEAAAAPTDGAATTTEKPAEAGK